MPQKNVAVSAAANLANNAPLLVIGLLLVDSLHFVFARLLLPHLPPVTSAMFVLAVATVEMAIFAGIKGELQLDTLRRNLGFFLPVGFLVAASTALNYASVAYIDPGTAALLTKSSVLFGLGFSLFWLRERLTGLQWLGVAIIIAGIVIITFQPGDYWRVGAIMVITSTFMYAWHAAIVKRHGYKFRFMEFFLFRLFCTTGFLFVFTTISGNFTLPQGNVWLLLILVGSVDVVISRGLYYLSLRKLKMSMHTIVLTLGPVVAIIWSLILFDVFPTAQEIIGGVAILAGVVLATVNQP